jgi:hypothetical protein
MSQDYGNELRHDGAGDEEPTPEEQAEIDQQATEAIGGSWAAEVETNRTGEFYGNAVRFATKEEAEIYVSDLMSRWLAVTNTRVVASPDPVNYKIVDGIVMPIDAEVIVHRIGEES